jgi:dsDNA-binding SOS-regulon protein
MPEFKPTEMRVIPALLKAQLDFYYKALKNPSDQADHQMEYTLLKMQQVLQNLKGEELETFLAEAKESLATVRKFLDAAEKEIAKLVDGD